MIGALVRKELRDQRPFLLLGIFLELLEQVSDLVTGNFARSPVVNEVFEGYSTFGILFLLVIAFALGTGLLTREHEEGTLEFLDSLPIGRSRLFAVKIAVGWGVLMAGIGVELLALLLRHAGFRTSLDASWHLELLLTGVLLQGAVIYVGLALGVVLSFAGRLSWMLAGMLGLFVYVAVKRLPAASVLDPTSIALARFEGSAWRIPWTTLSLQLTLATLALGLSLALFAGVWDRPLRRLWAFLAGPAAAPITVATALVGLVAFGLVAADSDTSGEEDGPAGGLAFPEPPLGQYDSSHYAFRYPATLGQRASPLFDQGDATYQRVIALLGLEPLPTPIQVDLTGSARHTAGLAFWNAIRMDLEAAESDQELLGILAHETTHVVAAQVVNAERAQRLDAMHAFNEGLARHVQRVLFPDAPDRDQGRTVAALLVARRQMRVEDVFDASALAANQDRDLVYPFGEAIVQQLVRRYGKEAPRRVLQAAGRAEAPEQLDPLAVWQDAFQTAGFDLARVVYDVQRDLEAEHARHRKAHDALPRPKPVVAEEDGTLRVTVHLDVALPHGWYAVCRFRAAQDTPPTDYYGPIPYYGQGCELDRSDVEDDTLWVQLGVVAPGGYYVYEPWVSFPLD